MFCFPDLSRSASPNSAQYREIPFYRFSVEQANPKMGGTVKFLLIAGIVAAALGALALCGISVGTTGFYVTIGELAVGAAIVAGALLAYYGAVELKMLPLPKARSMEEYRELIDSDQGNQYSYSITDQLQNHLERNTADLGSQTLRDLNSTTIYMLNGHPLSLEATDFADRVQEITENEELTQQILELAKTHPDSILFRHAVEKLIPDQGQAIQRLYINSRLEAYKRQREISPEEADFEEYVQKIHADFADQILKLSRELPDPTLFREAVEKLLPGFGNRVRDLRFLCHIQALRARFYLSLEETDFAERVGEITGDKELTLRILGEAVKSRPDFFEKIRLLTPAHYEEISCLYAQCRSKVFQAVLQESLERSGFAQKMLNITQEVEHVDSILEASKQQPEEFFETIKDDTYSSQIKSAYIACLSSELQSMSQNGKIPEKIWILLNQALFADLMGILMGRYNNENLRIQVSQRHYEEGMPSGNTLIDIVDREGVRGVRFGQICQITSLDDYSALFYIKVELTIDVERGIGKLTWDSPQTEHPVLT